ncbi:tannase/feruloyl esterase family alpha/beta hydrolase [Variovorax ureilyticus]|uniref:Tannase/feruloyl esterase family alpha/beta hydrolase n=1 Tax=Variovorax ureilyticus TaxID=1836198 RepID=A0ABU8VM12_9BURK
MNQDSFTRRHGRVSRPVPVALLAAAALSACGGGGGGGGNPVLGPSFPQVVADAAKACPALKGMTIDASAISEPTRGAVVASATLIPATADKPNASNTAIVQGTPDYCQVMLSIHPVDSAAPEILSQVNLPTSWNGKKLQFGGGGYNGTLITGVQPSRNAPPDVPMPLTRGYMTAGTDSGHESPANADPYAFALNAEALANHAFGSYKKTHDAALRIGVAYYGHLPIKSYYMGGSEGGREGLAMAQRYPQDYDGIVSIDPVMNWSALQTFGNYVGGIMQAKPGAWLGNKVQLVHDTIAGACDSMDGIADKVVSNTRACKPLADAALAAKRCPSGADEAATCFSDAQLAAINAAHAGYQFSFPLANGVTSYAGFNYGGEGLAGNWDRWMAGSKAPTTANAADVAASRLYQFGNAYVRYFIAQDPNFDPLSYDPANFKARVLQVSDMIDATNPDLSAFYAHGGKLILREDLSDTAESQLTGLNYWDSVVARMGRSTVDDFFAAFVATGLPHTSAGVAAGTVNAPSYGIPGSVDLLAPLENWVENGVAPGAQLTLVNKAALPPYNVIASKPLCRYGTYPKYTGTDPSGGNLASNYTCVSQ